MKYRVWVQVEALEDSNSNAVSLGAPECVYETERASEARSFLKKMGGKEPTAILQLLSKRRT